MIDYLLLVAFAAVFLITKTRNAFVALLLFASWFPLMQFLESWFWIQLVSAASCAICARLCSGKASMILLMFAIFSYLCAFDALIYPYSSTFIYDSYQYISFALNLLLLHELGRAKRDGISDTGVRLSGSRLCNYRRNYLC